MKINFLNKDISFTKSMKEETTKKLQPLEKYFTTKGDSALSVSLAKNGKFKRLKIVLPTEFGTIKSETTSKSYYEALDRAVDILERQARKSKEKIVSKPKGQNIQLEDVPEKFVVKEKIVILDPLTQEDAIEQMLELGHSFFVYTDKDLDSTCIVYQRHDGDYGLLICK